LPHGNGEMVNPLQIKNHEMKAITLLLAIQFFTTSFIPQNNVFVCTGPKSKVYHKARNCKGLRNCSTDLSSVSIARAKNMGRRACKIEF
jgi:hypothetical protein